MHITEITTVKPLVQKNCLGSHKRDNISGVKQNAAPRQI